MLAATLRTFLGSIRILYLFSVLVCSVEHIPLETAIWAFYSHSCSHIKKSFNHQPTHEPDTNIVYNGDGFQYRSGTSVKYLYS